MVYVHLGIHNFDPPLSYSVVSWSLPSPPLPRCALLSPPPDETVVSKAVDQDDWISGTPVLMSVSLAIEIVALDTPGQMISDA